jgi:V/A-type H+-transporting ATPase subunit I
MPGCGEADPTPLVAVIAPLLFGFMFGDVGHGLLLAVVGAFAGRRWPAVRMLVPGGLSAALFGVLYGCVFTREDLIPALWLHPFEEPVTLLAVAVMLGAAILVLGLLISALEAAWQGAFGKWCLTDAALVLVYLGLLGAIVHPGGILAALAGALWFMVGTAIAAERNRAQAALGSIGHLIERTVQLLLHTVSFARVGAFALAHAGLSVAVVGLGAAFSHPVASVAAIVLGNLLILVLEGLVVSIQTTRLVLFEFFVRFLRSTGRPFRPLPPPPTGEPEEGAVRG